MKTSEFANDWVHPILPKRSEKNQGALKGHSLETCAENISCSGSRERKHKRAFTPKNKSLEFKDFKAEPVRPKKAKIDKNSS
jgi:hypothetical protein